MALQLKQRRSLISMKLAGAFLAVFALFVQPLLTLNIPAAFAVAGIPGQIVVNEFSSGTGHDDWVELYNTTGAAANLSGWKLKDATVNTKGLSGTIPAHGFVSFDFSNKLDGSGDTISVEDDAGATINTVTYGSGGSVAAPSASQFAARMTDGSSTWELRTIDSRNTTNNTVIASPDLVAQDFGIWDNSPSFKGFNVGFAAANFGEVTSVELDVTREDGSHVIRTARTDMLAHLSDKTTLTQGSAPFVVSPGTSDGLSDSSWWSGQTNVAWTAATKPVSVKITVVGEHGTKSVTNNTFTNSAPGYENILPPQVEACNGSTFDGFTLGSVNGQAGWKVTNPNFDQEVENNTYGYEAFGCKSLRLSNSYISNSFGDQTFSAPAAALAGESAANDHYEATFSFGSTKQHQQSGLALSVSPDDGNGNRMSYVGLADQTGGITLTFYDTDENGTFVATPLTTVSRTEAHTIKFVIDMIDGESNDVVKIYLDGALVHTGTTWEQYYRESPEQAGNGNVVPSIDRLLLRSAGTAQPSNNGNGFLFDNVLVVTSASDVIAPSVPTLLSPVNRGYSKVNDFYFDWTDSTDNKGSVGLTYEFQSSQNPHTTNGVLDTNVWNNITNGNSEQKNLTDSRIHSTGAGDGDWYWQVRAIDAAGNKSNWTAVWKMTIDTGIPTTTIEVPTGMVGNSFTVSGDAQDNLSLNRVFVQLNRRDGGRYGETTIHLIGEGKAAHWSKTFDANTLDLPDGDYRAHVTVVDMAGNSSSSGWTDYFTIDSTGPAVDVTSPQADQTVNTSVDVTFSAIDPNQLGAYCVKLDGGSCVPNGYQWQPNNGETYTVTINTSAVVEGPHVITVRVTDRVGNATEVAIPIIVDDNTLPTASAGADQTVTSKMATLTAVSNGKSYKWTGGPAGTVFSNDGKALTSDVTVPDFGVYTFTFTATDANGHNNSDEVTVTFKDPTVTPTQPEDGSEQAPGGGIDNSNQPRPISPLSTSTDTTASNQLLAANGAAQSDGSSSSENTDDNGEVLGTTDDVSTPSENVAAIAPSDQGWKLWGIAWYWWLLAAAALAAIWWMIAAWRRRQAEADPSAGL